MLEGICLKPAGGSASALAQLGLNGTCQRLGVSVDIVRGRKKLHRRVLGNGRGPRKAGDADERELAGEMPFRGNLFDHGELFVLVTPRKVGEQASECRRILITDPCDRDAGNETSCPGRDLGIGMLLGVLEEIETGLSPSKKLLFGALPLNVLRISQGSDLQFDRRAIGAFVLRDEGVRKRLPADENVSIGGKIQRDEGEHEAAEEAPRRVPGRTRGIKTSNRRGNHGRGHRKLGSLWQILA